MSPRDLQRNPCWQAADLGHPLPDATHAVSVALPRWRDVVAYEDNDPNCRSQLRAVYPRFGFHPLVSELARAALDESGAPPTSSAWPYPTLAAAEAALAHCLREAPDAHTTIATVRGLACLIADPDSTAAAKAFWQHAGLGASSRLAAIALGKESAPSDSEANAALQAVISRLSQMYGCTAENISLHPSGMAAQHEALRLVNHLHPGRPSLQIGFPYVDVLKQPQVLFNGAELLIDSSPAVVEAALKRLKPAALVVELPSNPLLQCVDLPTIAKLAHARAIPVIADDTIGSGLNIDALPHADLVFSSLTKSFAGRGDVLAGSLIVSPYSTWRQTFLSKRSSTEAGILAGLAAADAIPLEQGSRDLNQRLPQLNANTLALAEQLKQHPAVERVFHPADCANFTALMRPDAGNIASAPGHGCSAPGHGCSAPGHGCLLSFELKGGTEKAQRVYDALSVCKGPSLGTAFTLCCPYVLLAHYEELPWAASCGVPSHLLRVSVGLEDPAELWQRFKQALEA
ncbi:PLP-dependent transferase [Synechococcus sp. HK01-R]|uniref:PLP-dependent transferase n=1 Tax=Synechococcus sp. HK01-R TaxID=2751171 RepID=UPI00162ABCB3|nr:PLP-dependent transferase [Synechococcus sp. HK01-R]QNG27129.1 PLP-dependent transferase [Synechococcus sp. HK01-R]